MSGVTMGSGAVSADTGCGAAGFGVAAWWNTQPEPKNPASKIKMHERNIMRPVKRFCRQGSIRFHIRGPTAQYDALKV